MASHIPVNTNEFRSNLLNKALKEYDIKDLKEFERNPLDESYAGKGVYLQRLSEDYEMNEYHGLVDDEILAISNGEQILEYHLDKDQKINQIYLVV